MPRSFPTLILAVLSCTSAFAQAWSHDPSAANGPLSWGFLGAYNSFATCGTDKQAVGAKQTPIDIQTKTALRSDLSGLNFRYRPTKLIVENLAHVVEVVNEAAESVLSVGSSPADTYKLVQFHFHTPSEHKIDGVASPMELHLVHQNALGELAVVGVMMNVENVRANPIFDRIFNNAPYLAFISNANTASPPLGEINPAELLPRVRSFYTYTGSLTTPPCSEGVHWFVLTQPAFISSAAVATYQNLLNANNRFSFNSRPIQPLNGRPVLVSR